MRRTCILTLACGGAVVAPSSALGHSNEPRTAVIFDDVNTCALTVDRAADPTVMMTYSIAMEDLPNPDHDLPDAKTHQFIAVCRSWSTREPPPRYLAVDDLQRSIDIGYEEPSALDDPEMTFETSIVWENCWRRITADDARLPLTPDAALDGVVWDTTDVEATAWFPVGHTFDPPWNVWKRAPYAIRVEDDLAAPVDAPVVVVPDLPKVVEHSETIVLSPCIAARGPVGVELRYATTADPSGWKVLANEMVEADDPAPSFEFSAPEETWGKSLLISVAIVDGEQRDAVGYPRNEIIVLAAPPETPENPFPEPPEEGDGGGCTVTPNAPAPLSFLWILSPLACLRRRRNEMK